MSAVAVVWLGTFALTERQWERNAVVCRAEQAALLTAVNAGRAAQTCFVVPQALFNNALPKLVELYRPGYQGTIAWRYGRHFALAAKVSCVPSTGSTGA